MSPKLGLNPVHCLLWVTGLVVHCLPLFAHRLVGWSRCLAITNRALCHIAELTVRLLGSLTCWASKRRTSSISRTLVSVGCDHDDPRKSLALSSQLKRVSAVADRICLPG